MKNNTLKAMGIAIGTAMSLMYATGMDAQAAEETMLPNSYDEAAQDEDFNGDGDKKRTGSTGISGKRKTSIRRCQHPVKLCKV